jgi:hypothetical protein
LVTGSRFGANSGEQIAIAVTGGDVQRCEPGGKKVEETQAPEPRPAAQLGRAQLTSGAASLIATKSVVAWRVTSR